MRSKADSRLATSAIFRLMIAEWVNDRVWTESEKEIIESCDEEQGPRSDVVGEVRKCSLEFAVLW